MWLTAPNRSPWAGELGWMAVATAMLAVLTVIDLSLPGRTNITGALVIAPFLAASGVRPIGVAALGAAAVGAAAGLDFLDRNEPHASVATIVVVVAGTLLATQASSLRIKRQQRIVELAMVAEATQRAIIRKPAPRVGSVAVATAYQSSARAATVGGDCYEVLDTPFGTRAFVGDVRGHGMPSVRLAALVLGGFRAMAYTTADLAAVARELDQLVTRYARDPTATDVDGEEFVTAVMCQIDNSTLSDSSSTTITGNAILTIANCGHPPPLLIGPDGEVRALEASVPASPLGVGSDPALDHIEVPPRVRILLYTDGLADAMDNSGNAFDLDKAAKELAAGPLETVTGRLIEQLNAHALRHLNDDVAVMLLEPRPGSRPGTGRADAPDESAVLSEANFDGEGGDVHRLNQPSDQTRG
jgi:sigma-B regulation protein RsbU (phosphoserine phosphatase)